MDGTNWSLGAPPTMANAANTQIDGGTPFSPLIGAGQIASTAAGDTWGPEWGATLDIEGGTYTGATFVGLNPEQWDSANRSYINLGRNASGGTISIQNFLIGSSWWYGGGEYVTYNQYSGTAIANDWIWLGGQMDLYGGYTESAGGINIDVAGNGSAICNLNIFAPSADGDGGKLSLPDSYYTGGQIATWVAGGFIASPNGTLQYDEVSEPGRVVISAAVPEPSTITLLCLALLGGLALIRRN